MYLVPLTSTGAKYILLGVQNREPTTISLLPLKIEEKKRIPKKPIRAFTQICLLQLGEGGQSKDLSPIEREH